MVAAELQRKTGYALVFVGIVAAVIGWTLVNIGVWHQYRTDPDLDPIAFPMWVGIHIIGIHIIGVLFAGGFLIAEGKRKQREAK